MAIRRNATVVDRDGVRLPVREFIVGDDGTSTVVIELATGSRVSLNPELLAVAPDGGYQIDARWADLASRGGAGRAVDVVAEEVSVKVQPVVRDALRVRRRVVEESQVVETPVWREHIVVERVPKDILVEHMPAVRQEGDTLVVPCVEEEVVVARRLRVREEVRIRVVREQVIDRQTIVVRRHHIDVDREAHPKKQGDGT